MTQLAVNSALSDLSGISPKARNEALYWLDRFEPITSMGRGKAELFREIAKDTGLSESTVRHKFYSFLREGVGVLVNRKHEPQLWQVKSKPIGRNDAFLDYWRGLLERRQRKSKAAYRDFIEQLEQWQEGIGKPIPGLGRTPPENAPGCRHPRGFSYDNLIKLRPSDFELAAARRGRWEASKFRPQLFSTREGMEVGQFYMFDDMEHDVLVNALKYGQGSVRPVEIGVIDVCSGCRFDWGVRPILKDATTQKKKVANERDMRFLLAKVLCYVGFHPDGVTLIVERGTATIRDTLAKELELISGGLVKVDMSGRTGAPALAGQYRGPRRGNPRHKAALESLHNLIHNELDALPGQLGKDRDHIPADTAGRQKHNDDIVAAVLAMPPEEGSRLVKSFYEWSEFEALLSVVHQRINAREEHDLEGWQECGFTQKLWRIDPSMPWAPRDALDRLPAARREMVLAMIQDDPHLTSIRRMSPQEVWNQGKDRLVTLGIEAVAAILGRDLAKPMRPGANHLFEFEDRELGPGVHRYLAMVRDRTGSEEPLSACEEYLAFANPYQPEHLVVCDRQLRFLGTCRRWDKVRRDDVQGFERKMGEIRKIESQLLAPVAKRGRAMAKQAEKDALQNIRTLQSLTPAPEQPTGKRPRFDDQDDDVLASSDEESAPISRPYSAFDDGDGLP